MNHRLEMKADSSSSHFKDRGQAISVHLPEHPNTKIYVQRQFLEHRCTLVCCYCDHIQHTSVLMQWPHTAYQYVVTVAKYCIPVCYYSGHILHPSLLLQWPPTAYQFVVTVATFCISVFCYSGHILHISVLMQWPLAAYQCFVTVATYCIRVC
jgi:hypothetical protein